MSDVALITGAAGALGSSICRELARRGWSLALAGLPSDPTEELALELAKVAPDSRFQTFTADLGDPGQLRDLVAAAQSWSGGLNGLVNNAGRPTRTALRDMSTDEWDGVMQVNLRALMLLIKAFAEGFDRTRGQGSIVNVSSRTYATGGPVGYVSSKAGLVGLTRAASWELGPVGIRVNAVAPSTMITPFTARGRNAEQIAEYETRQTRASALKRLLVPDEVATGVAFLLGSESSFITGEVLHIAGGLQLPPIP